MKKQIPLIIILGLLVAGAAVVGWAVWSGRMLIQVKDPAQQFVARTFVCDDAVVAKYNDAVKAESFEAYKDGLKSTFDDVDGRAHKNDDPTCVYLLYRYYLSQNNVEQVNALVTRLKELHGQQNYPSNKIADIESIQQVESRASIIESGSIGEEGGAG